MVDGRTSVSAKVVALSALKDVLKNIVTEDELNCALDLNEIAETNDVDADVVVVVAVDTLGSTVPSGDVVVCVTTELKLAVEVSGNTIEAEDVFVGLRIELND